MNITILKAVFSLALMAIFLIMAFTINDDFKNQLSISIVIITGTLALKFLSTQNQLKNE
jgi:hypothetical protein